IALWISGKLPKKWKFQGRTVSDGTDPVYDWQGWIPTEQNPHIVNPERGFVSSANQESAAPDYPYYLDDDFAPYERGRRINDLLERMDNITPMDMQRMQMDNFAYNSSTIIPEMIDWTNTEELSTKELEVLEMMRDWDFMMEAELIQPTVYQNWFDQFYYDVFNDEFSSIVAELRYPSPDIFVEVIKNEPDMMFLDNINTPEEEALGDVVTTSYKKIISRLAEAYGDDYENWKWGYLIDNDLDHLANIPGFGAQNLFSSGAAEAINAVRGTHGPSWRMVVELGPEVKGWGVYPGGQSGNPGSSSYDDMVEEWRTGQLFELNFMRSEPANYLYKFEMTGEE
ncbi:MAG TPA: penicillin acylase family protein, partial [Balneolaceae bacterium]|nr:penicillin acylase family protein [Balneolaceae bacterium]